MQNSMPARNTLHQPCRKFLSVAELEHALLSVLKSIDGVSVIQKNKNTHDLLVNASGNTWSRAARRRKLTATNGGASDVPESTHPLLTCQIHYTAARLEAGPCSGADNLFIEFTWVRGKDRGLFESFMSHVARKVDTFRKKPDIEMAHGSI